MNPSPGAHSAWAYDNPDDYYAALRRRPTYCSEDHDEPIEY